MTFDTQAGNDPEPAVPGVWLIAGPTASGKSALALALAERLGGEVVNADALQVYRDLRVLSARPAPEEEARVPHHLYGVADGADGWSVGRWLRAVLPVLEDIRGRNRPAVVVGGTGLYFAALTRGLAQTPKVADALRAETDARFAAEGEAAFRAMLAAFDPRAAARIQPGDRQRLVRAAAVHAATGRALSDWRETTAPALARGAWRALVIEPPRETLYARCDARFDAMLAQGALEEAARLDARGLDPALPVLKAVGYRELAAVARGELTLDAAREAASRETRRYAKRQTTWLRNQARDWPRLARVGDAEAVEPALTHAA